MATNDNDDTWLDILLQMLPEKERARFSVFWARAKSGHSPNDEFLPVMYVLGYLNLFTVILVKELIRTNTLLENLQRQLSSLFTLLTEIASELKFQAGQTSEASARAAKAAENAANSRLPWARVFACRAMDGLILGACVILGFYLLGRNLPATPRTAHDYEAAITRMNAALNIQQDRIVELEKINDAYDRRIREEKAEPHYPAGSEGGFSKPWR